MTQTATDLATHIQSIPLLDTHEHLGKESDYVENGPDVLCDLFENYIIGDLVVAGADQAATQRLIDRTDSDIAGRFNAIQAAWEKCRHTGYGEAVRARDASAPDDAAAVESARAHLLERLEALA